MRGRLALAGASLLALTLACGPALAADGNNATGGGTAGTGKAANGKFVPPNISNTLSPAVGPELYGQPVMAGEHQGGPTGWVQAPIPRVQAPKGVAPGQNNPNRSADSTIRHMRAQNGRAQNGRAQNGTQAGTQGNGQGNGAQGNAQGNAQGSTQSSQASPGDNPFVPMPVPYPGPADRNPLSTQLKP